MDKNKNWKKEIARDTIALGSIPFYFIVIIRAIIGEYMPFVYQLAIAFLILLIFYWLFKSANQHIARGLVLVVFTSIFYNVMLYTVFAALLWIFMIVSAYYLKPKFKDIAIGVVFGIISTALSYGLVSLIPFTNV
jgi:hypothetical protein